MNRLPVPRDPEDITPHWLTQALASHGASKPATVTSYTAQRIGTGLGFLSRLFRLSLHYDNETDLPSAVILKLPSTNAGLPTPSRSLRQHHREVRFYQQVPPCPHLRFPHAYYCGLDPATGNTALLLEDLSSYRQGDSVLGCSLDEARHCITQLAKFQASWWGHSDLNKLDWMPPKDAETTIYQEQWHEAWTSFTEKAGSALSPGLRSLGEQLGPAIPSIKAKLSKPPHTIIHGDFRLDNCFFPPDPSSQPPFVFDWEFCARGRGPCDIATFISESFPPHQRRAQEIPLLRTYHSTLVDHGIHDYSFEECLHDYRLSMLEVLALWVITAPCCDFTSPRATTYLHNTLHRLDAAISDLSSATLLQG